MMRVVGLIDMDCFYAQVHQRLQPDLWGKPVIVVQHTRQGAQGGILAVSYEARTFGVKRGPTVTEAKALCPHINVCHVPIGEFADKADIQIYRDASAEVFEVLNNYDSDIIVEKASVDEAFLNLSVYVDKILQGGTYDSIDVQEVLKTLPSSHLADGMDQKESEEERVERLTGFLEECQNHEDQMRLLIAAQAIEDIRAKIREKTQFYCSAGVGNNKMMAKLVCARHKPRQQTIVPYKYVKDIMKHTKIGDVRGFGGKMGQRLKDELEITMMGEILELDYVILIEKFPDQHEWLRSVAEGYCDEAVKPRAESSSIAVSKNFPGKSAIGTVKELKEWLEGLIRELGKRLVLDQIQNKRTAENLTYSILTEEGKPQKTLKINSYHPDILIEQLWKVLKPTNKANDDYSWSPKVYNIFLSATRFSPGVPARTQAITEWLDNTNNRRNRVVVEKKAVEGEEVEDCEEIVVISKQKKKTTSKPSTSIDDSIIILDDDDDVEMEEVESHNTNNSDDIIEVDGKRFTKTVFRALPEFLRKQYEHRIALESARKLKLMSNSKNNAKNPRKRGGKIGGPELKKQKTTINKPLTSFFQKKN